MFLFLFLSFTCIQGKQTAILDQTGRLSDASGWTLFLSRSYKPVVHTYITAYTSFSPFFLSFLDARSAPSLQETQERPQHLLGIIVLDALQLLAQTGFDIRQRASKMLQNHLLRARIFSHKPSKDDINRLQAE